MRGVTMETWCFCIDGAQQVIYEIIVDTKSPYLNKYYLADIVVDACK